jgi:hypothetical protein
MPDHQVANAHGANERERTRIVRDDPVLGGRYAGCHERADTDRAEAARRSRHENPSDHRSFRRL